MAYTQRSARRKAIYSSMKGETPREVKDIVANKERVFSPEQKQDREISFDKTFTEGEAPKRSRKDRSFTKNKALRAEQAAAGAKRPYAPKAPSKYTRKPRPEDFKNNNDRPRREFSSEDRKFERPKREFGDRPSFDRPRRDNDRPNFDRPRRDNDRPQRSFGDRPNFDKPRSPRPEGERSFDRPRRDGDAPRRSFGDKPSFGGPRRDGDRPQRSFGDKPRFDGPRKSGFKTQSNNKNFGKPSGSRKPAGAKPNKTYGD